MTNEYVLLRQREKATAKKYPRLIAHMIAESMGYYTVTRAISTVHGYQDNKPYYCEMHTHAAGGYDDEKVLEVVKRMPKIAFKNRHYHKGYMTSYLRAKAAVSQFIETDKQNDFAAWF